MKFFANKGMNKTEKLRERRKRERERRGKKRRKQKNFGIERGKGEVSIGPRLEDNSRGECIVVNSCSARSIATVVNVYRIDSKAFAGSM